MSRIEQLILSRDFVYLQPYFYNNPYALRCELGIGADDEEFMKTAYSRALAVYNILFSKGADAVIFNRYTDDTECAELVDPEGGILRQTLETRRHAVVKGLPTYFTPEDEEFETVHRDRIICYSDGLGFDHERIISDEVNEYYGEEFTEPGLVSFDNECIMSVYDSRGCDIVFAEYGKMAEFYPLLEPYFLDYDHEKMRRRFDKGQTNC